MLALFQCSFKTLLPALCLSWWDRNVSIPQSQPAEVTELAWLALQSNELGRTSRIFSTTELLVGRTSLQRSSSPITKQQQQSSATLADSRKDTRLCSTVLSHCIDKWALCNRVVVGGTRSTFNVRCRVYVAEPRTESSSPVL